MEVKEKTLDDAFHATLRDVLWAEKQALKALKKSAKAATVPELKTAFETHHTETQGQIGRLEQVFAMIGKPARAKTCEAMKGISAEIDKDQEEFGGGPAGDAVLIGCGQAVEHYEMARYGTLKSWAGQLGLGEAVTLLDATLQEEKKADALLSKIANGLANPKARKAA